MSPWFVRLASMILALMLIAPAHATCPLPNARVALHEFPPFYYTDESGETKGKLYTIVGQLMAQLGCDWQPKFYPVPRLLASLTSGNADLGMLIKHPSLDRAHYGSTPVAELTLRLYRQPGQSAANDLTHLAKGSRVVVRRGYGYHGMINQLLRPESGLVLVPADTHEQAASLFKSKQGDYLLNYAGPTDYYLELNPVEGIESDLIAAWPVYLVLSEKIRDGEQLVQRLDDEVRPLLTQASVQ